MRKWRTIAVTAVLSLGLAGVAVADFTQADLQSSSPCS